MFYFVNLGKMIQFYFKHIGDEESLGQNVYTYTLHAHLHLIDQVRQQGPLECHTLNSFEVK